MNVSESNVGTYRHIIKVNSSAEPEFIDITDDVQLAVENAKIQISRIEGFIYLFYRNP